MRQNGSHLPLLGVAVGKDDLDLAACQMWRLVKADMIETDVAGLEHSIAVADAERGVYPLLRILVGVLTVDCMANPRIVEYEARHQCRLPSVLGPGPGQDGVVMHQIGLTPSNSLIDRIGSIASWKCIKSCVTRESIG